MKTRKIKSFEIKDCGGCEENKKYEYLEGRLCAKHCFIWNQPPALIIELEEKYWKKMENKINWIFANLIFLFLTLVLSWLVNDDNRILFIFGETVIFFITITSSWIFGSINNYIDAQIEELNKKINEWIIEYE